MPIIFAWADPDHYHVDTQPDLLGGRSFIREWGRIGRRGQIPQTVYSSQAETKTTLERQGGRNMDISL